MVPNVPKLKINRRNTKDIVCSGVFPAFFSGVFSGVFPVVFSVFRRFFRRFSGVFSGVFSCVFCVCGQTPIQQPPQLLAICKFNNTNIDNVTEAFETTPRPFKLYIHRSNDNNNNMKNQNDIVTIDPSTVAAA